VCVCVCVCVVCVTKCSEPPGLRRPHIHLGCLPSIHPHTHTHTHQPSHTNDVCVLPSCIPSSYLPTSIIIFRFLPMKASLYASPFLRLHVSDSSTPPLSLSVCRGRPLLPASLTCPPRPAVRLSSEVCPPLSLGPMSLSCRAGKWGCLFVGMHVCVCVCVPRKEERGSRRVSVCPSVSRGVSSWYG